MVDVKYIANGPVGKRCGDCSNFKTTRTEPSKGTCYGREVVRAGSCSFFKKK